MTDKVLKLEDMPELLTLEETAAFTRTTERRVRTAAKHGPLKDAAVREMPAVGNSSENPSDRCRTLIRRRDLLRLYGLEDAS